MKLSNFFTQVSQLWSGTTLFQFAAWLLLICLCTFGGYRLAHNQYSNAKVYAFFGVALVAAIGFAEGSSNFYALVIQPVTASFFAATAGAGFQVYERLQR